jgi:hypothetical protein
VLLVTMMCSNPLPTAFVQYLDVICLLQWTWLTSAPIHEALLLFHVAEFCS